MKPIFLISVISFAVFSQIYGEEITFGNLVKVFNTKCTEHKVPVKSLDFMVQIAPNVNEIEEHLKVPMKEFISEEKIPNVLKFIPDKMKLAKMKLESGAANFFRGLMDGINSDVAKIGKLNHEIATALAFEPHCEDFEKAFKHWADEKNANVDHLKKVESSVDSMQAYYKHLHAAFDKEMNHAQTLRSKIELEMVSTNEIFDKLHGTNSQGVKHIVDDAYSAMMKILSNQQKLSERLEVVMRIVNEYNTKRISWAKYIVGEINAIDVPTSTDADSLISSLETLKL